MSLPLIVTREAEEDLAEAKAWYERKLAGLGDRFWSLLTRQWCEFAAFLMAPRRSYRVCVVSLFAGFRMAYSIESIRITSQSSQFITVGGTRAAGKRGPSFESRAPC